MKYLRHKKDGTIYDWHPILAGNPLCEEVTEMEAYPERFIPKGYKGKKSALSLETKTEEPPKESSALDREVTADLAKAVQK
jgi:hypothetical protein